MVCGTGPLIMEPLICEIGGAEGQEPMGQQGSPFFNFFTVSLILFSYLVQLKCL